MPPLPPLPTNRRTLYTWSALAFLTLLLLAYSAPRLLRPPPLHKLTSHLSHLSRQNAISSYQLPRWDDHPRIRSSVDQREARLQAYPTMLDHLAVADAPSPFRLVSVVSGWLDRRPELVGRAPEVAVVGTMEGRPWLRMPEARFDLPEGAERLECWVSVERPGKQARSFKAKVVLVGPRDPHDDVKDWAVTMFSCPVPFGGDNDLAGTDWDHAEIFVTLSLPNLPPPMESFVRVNVLPAVDPTRHKTGHGSAAVCLAPLTGDLYAPHLRAFIAHYRALGFAHFYPYLLNPGPATLAVLRELALEDGITPIRWGLPKTWDAETREHQRPFRRLAVEVDRWRVPGMEMLPPAQEFRLGTSRFRDADVPVWYYGQSAAQQDCAFRAMRAGARWVASLDFDEWLVLVPAAASGAELVPWPVPQALPRPGEVQSILGDWLRQLPITPWYPHVLEGETREHMRIGWEQPEVDSGVLSSAYLFKSAFGCMTCQPTAVSERGRLEAWEEGRLPLVMGASVRHQPWLPEGVRAKTIYDPWAWWTIGIHMPGISFAEYAASWSFCASSRHAPEPDDDEVRCARTLLDTFGIDALKVEPYDPSFVRSASQSRAPRPATGAMLHLRVPHHERGPGAGWVEEAQGGGALGAGRGGGNGTVGFSFEALARVPQPQWGGEYDVPGDIGDSLGVGYELDLVEDWTAWEVMHAALAQSLRLMRAAERERVTGRLRGWSLLGGVAFAGLVGYGWYRGKAGGKKRAPATVWSMVEMRDGTGQGTGAESPLLVGRRTSRFREQGEVAVEMRDRRA